MKRILLTGASGFVGAEFAKVADEKDFMVRGAVRSLPEAISVFSELVAVGNISFDTNWQVELDSIDVVIHLAARVHVMQDTANSPLSEFRSINTRATLNLAKQASESGVKRFVYLSSIKVNGESTSAGVQFTTEDVFVPSDPYALSKYEAEQALLALAKETGMEVVIIRPPLIYGEGVKANFASLMKLAGKGLPLPFRGIKYNRRSLVSVYNLVDLIKVCIDHPCAANQIFLVSDDNDLSTSQMVALMAKVQGKHNFSVSIPVWCFRLLGKIFKKDAVVDRLVGSLQLDIEHTKKTLDWVPPYTVEHGFKLAAKKML
ncbi:MAG: UDP-glucose 4-epimerase [Oleiphilaceae bacterium]